MMLDHFLVLTDLVLYFHLVLPVLLLIATAVYVPAARQLAAYLLPLARFLDAFAKQTGQATSWLTLLMVLVTTTVVILRYIFGMSFIWMQESIIYMHGLLFLLAASWTLWIDGHVRVDIFYRTASQKRRALVDLLGTYFFLFPFMFLILDTALPYIEFSWAVQEGSRETSGIQAIYLLKTVILIFAWMMVLQGLSIAIHRAAWLAGFQDEIDSEAPATTLGATPGGDAE